MGRALRGLKGWAACLVLMLVLAGCGQGTVPSTEPEAPKKLSVYTSLYPYQFFAEQIGGGRVEVHNLVPPGAEPHEFEPTPKDVVKLDEADVFVYNGAGFERWIDQVLKAIDTSDMVIVKATEHVNLLSSPGEDGHSGKPHGAAGERPNVDGAGAHGNKAKAEPGHTDERGNGPYDPHVWLDPVRAKDIARAIRDAFVRVDPEGKATYDENYRKLAEELDRLHAEYEAAVKQAPRKEIIVSHSAFGYLADRYGLKQIAISGLSPSDEPSQKELQEILALAKAHHAKYILFETLVSNKVAEVVREEIGAEALTLNPLEGLSKEDVAKGKDYFTVMRENLAVLKKALGVEA